MKKIIKGLGAVATLGSLILIILEVRKMDIDMSVFTGNNIYIFALFAIIYTGLVFLLGTPWGMYVKKITDRKIPMSKLNLVFTKSNLMKYIPGNIFQYVGRNEIAIEYGLKHKDVVCATVMDVISLAFSGFLIAIIFSLNDIAAYLLQYVSETVILLFGIVAIILLFLALFIISKIEYFSFLFEKRMILILFKGITLLLIFHLCSAGMFCVTLTEVLGVELQGVNYAQIIGAWCMGYLVGYVVPGSPGGLGVREVTIAFLLSNVVDVPVVALGTVFMRVANIVGEVAAFFIAFIIDLLRKEVRDKNELEG